MLNDVLSKFTDGSVIADLGIHGIIQCLEIITLCRLELLVRLKNLKARTQALLIFLFRGGEYLFCQLQITLLHVQR